MFILEPNKFYEDFSKKENYDSMAQPRIELQHHRNTTFDLVHLLLQGNPGNLNIIYILLAGFPQNLCHKIQGVFKVSLRCGNLVKLGHPLWLVSTPLGMTTVQDFINCHKAITV